MSLVTYRSDNPRRPPDWRWQRANLLQNASNRPGEDAFTRTAISFIRMIRRCGSDEDLLEALDANPLLFEAYSIYNSSDNVANMRWELEARILSREPQYDISNKLGISSGIVDYYERFFFDVRNRLNAHGLIMHAVIRQAIRTGVTSPDCFWKLIGYWCGPIILDAVIYGFNHPQQPASRDQLRSSLNEIARDTISVKSTSALLTMKINEDTQAQLFDLWSRLLELESKSDSTAGGETNIMANVDALLTTFTINQYRPDLQAEHKKQETTLEQHGITPRAYEVLDSEQAAADQKLALTAKFPDQPENND